MCFGPLPSFGSSVLLTVIGAATIRRVRHKRQIVIALFPLLFAVQQFDEGLLWVAILRGDPPEQLHRLSMVFLFVALCIWPISAPYSVYLLEADERRRRLMIPIVAIGIGFAVYASFFLATGSCSASVARLSIKYRRDLPGFDAVLGTLYLTSIFGTWLLASDRRIVKMAVVNFALGSVAWLYNHRGFISIWCFFAAFWSGMIYFALGRQPRQPESSILPRRRASFDTTGAASQIWFRRQKLAQRISSLPGRTESRN